MSIGCGGFLMLLWLAIIVMRIAKVIKWAWWLVLCPLWVIPAIIVVGVILFLIGLVLFGHNK